MPSSEQRRARHEGVERGPELRAAAILLLQDFILRAGNDEMRAGTQVIGEFLDRGGETVASLSWLSSFPSP